MSYRWQANIKAITLLNCDESTNNMSNQFHLFHMKLEKHWLKSGKHSQ